MSDQVKLYHVSEELKVMILDFLMNPFDSTIETIKLLENKSSLTEEEINKVVNLLGKFPAYSVYPIIEQFKGNLKIEEIEQQ
jgi:hypothetical protein